MIPSAINSDYPKFVPNQVLTSDNLNDLFGYLDEQQRITRTNLVGIGIVCGLQVKSGNDVNGSFITITRGTGVTSRGHLVTVPEITYHQYNVFDAVKPEYYDRFVNIGTKTGKMPLWELKQLGESEDPDNPFHKLDDPSGFLSDKVVLLFVELLETNNKNCDPNSCDDKGTTVNVNFRALLVEKSNVVTLMTGTSSVNESWLSLPEMSMRRFDVKATPFFECLNIFNAYRSILNETFLSKVQSVLTESYNTLTPVLASEFPANPFATLANDLQFLHDDSIDADQLVAIQYYYDLFSDLLQAYDEFREKGIQFIGACVPDDIFPRHLLLDLAIPDASEETSDYRHYFIPSPVLSEQKKIIAELRILFKKLALLIPKFKVPSMTIKGANKKSDENIRITPTYLGDIPFSSKSIPYYYDIQGVSDTLLRSWSPEKTLRNKFKRNLSYHAPKYNASQDEISNPLAYDLENFNFLRIEGHIGKPYKHVVKNITDLRNQNRLPFDIVALSADITAITSFIKELAKMLTSDKVDPQAALASFTGTTCHFNDLETLFDSLMTELTGKLGNEMKFFYDLRRDQKRQPLADPPNNVPQVPLLVKTDSAYRFTNNSIGHEFELFYATVKNLPFIPIQVFFQSFGQGGNNDLMDFVFKAVLYYIEMLFETVTSSLSNFSFFHFNFRYFTMIFTVKFIKALNKFNSELFPLSEEENDHLDALLSIVVDGRVTQLYLEFLKRVLHVKIMQQAGYYAICHPGIQHKAGVPMGGTFVLVYHEAKEEEEVVQTVTAGVAATATPSFVGGRQQTINNNSRFAEFRGTDNTAPQEQLHMFAADVDEKVFIAKDRVESGLKRSFKVDFAKGANVKGEPAKADDAKAPADAFAPAAKVTTTPVRTAQENLQNYLVAAAVYLKNRKDDELDENIEDIPDGAVIADFYLPYLCCSDCPPIQIVVQAEQEEPNKPPVAHAGDNVTIELPVNSVTLDGTSSSDPDGTIQTYKWELVTSNAATIETPDNAVTVVSGLNAGEYIFKLTVTDNDGATDEATVKITVNLAKNIPPTAVAFTDTPVVTFGENTTALLIGAQSFDPDGTIVSYSWSQLPAPTTNVLIDTPSGTNTTVRFFSTGKFSFSLTVTDNRGDSSNTSLTIEVVKSQVTKTCGPATDILDRFQTWKKQADEFSVFKEVFNSYFEVESFFTEILPQIFNKAVEDQIDLFDNDGTPERLIKWLNELQSIITKNNDLRFIALGLYRILNQLAMYIVCIQDQDVNKAKVKMASVFKLISDHTDEWQKIIDAGGFSKKETAILKEIKNDITNEIQRVKNNGEETVKANYLKILNEILDNFSSLPS